MTTTELDQIYAKANTLLERCRQVITSIEELSSSPLSPPTKSPAYQNLSKAESRFVDMLNSINYVLAAHGLATLLRRVGGEVAGEEGKGLVTKMNTSLAYIEEEIGFAESQLAVAAIAIAKRVSMPGSGSRT